MKNILSKFSRTSILTNKISKHKGAQVISFDKLLYTQLTQLSSKGENLEEALFERACTELGIKEKFCYSMSYALDDDKAFVFLVKDEILEHKNDFAFAEPLLWRNLNQLQTTLTPFYAVFVIEKDYGYIAFFGDKRLLYCKNLPQFTLSYLQDKDEAQRLHFIKERILGQGRIKELCELYKSKAFVLVGDELNLGKTLSGALQIPNLGTQIQVLSANLQANLILAEIQRRDEGVNFLHHKVDETPLKRLVGVFVLCLMLGFCASLGEFFIKQYQLKRSFVAEFDEQMPEFSTLQKENEQNSLLIKQKKEIIAYIDDKFDPIILRDTLEPLFNFLYQRQIRPQSLKISDNEITLLIVDDEKGAKFIKELYTNSLFTLKRKELTGGHYELVLEQK